ncbi:hypothetical protein C8R48DRAFT_677960 [Suillus tomentosus]|nr:hypothetical protein C8R48DRAFT_677960 [Suillus tomentosus]
MKSRDKETWQIHNKFKHFRASYSLLFLRNGVDELGKTNNAAHPALKAAAITFFYTGSYHIAHRRPDIFKEELPLQSLALCNCVFDRLVKNGSGKYFPKFTAKDYSSVCCSMVVELKNVMKDVYHGPKLTRQLPPSHHRHSATDPP